MAPQQYAEPVSSSASSSASHPRSTPTPSAPPTTESALITDINTVSLVVDPSYTATSSTTTIASSETSTAEDPSSSDAAPSLTVSIVIIVIVIAVILCLSALFIRLYRRRKSRLTPRSSRERPNVLRRPESRKRSRRPSDFWSADASKPASALPTSPRTPNEHAGLLGQEQAIMREISRGSVVGARGLSPISLQLPTPTHRPQHTAWDPSTDLEQQQAAEEGPGPTQPRISQSEEYFYPYEPSEHSARNSTSTIHSRSLLSPVTAEEPAYSSSNLEQERDTRPNSSVNYTTSSSSSRHQSTEPFALDNLVLGSLVSPSRAQSPSQPSTRSSIEPGPSLSTFPLPPTRHSTIQSPESVLQLPLPSEPQPPRPALQSDISQTLTSLRRSGSQATHHLRNTSSASTVASRRPRLDIIIDDTRHPPSSFSAGYFMHTSPETEKPRLSRVVSETASAESVYSTTDDEPVPDPSGSRSRHDSASSEMDGVRYSREDGRASPALPDSVRTSVLSFFETRR